MRKIDCCFLVTGNSKKTYQKLSKTYSAIEPPTWALLLAESTRSSGFKVKIIDANAENLSEVEIHERIKELAPKIICFVVYGQNVNAGTTNMTGVIEVAKYLKDIVKIKNYNNFKNVEHVHFFGYYIGNYPDLSKNKILKITRILNSIKF